MIISSVSQWNSIWPNTTSNSRNLMYRRLWILLWRYYITCTYNISNNVKSVIIFLSFLLVSKVSVKHWHKLRLSRCTILHAQKHKKKVFYFLLIFKKIASFIDVDKMEKARDHSCCYKGAGSKRNVEERSGRKRWTGTLSVAQLPHRVRYS